ncbi:MAG TPA: CHAT domain-containing protein, partial [Catalimonadaceae bacterium]|nr:CHAT domain-containing protein [Catalimonadaceae bacterium]
TDKISYVALLVKAGMSHPEMVEIENGNDLEDHWIQWYKNCINRKLPDRESYNRYWKPIEQRLGKGVKRIFISPDGIYHSINLNTLQNPATGKYLLEERDIRLLTNTREIALNESPMSNLPVACLVGYPDYNVNKERRAETLRRGRNLTTDSYTLVTRNDVFAELPGTKKEVESISSVMKANGWQVDSYIGETALEDKIKETRKPRVMHIATHGFFQPDSTPGSNPLIHSGLLLTGANKTLAGERDEMVEDGILTAYEAMNLNLDNTDLVVLSACETGLGEIKNGEGVYGLQRAFKVAGAKALIMSLWKVDDDATNELMMRFYKNWLSPTQPPQGGGANALKSPIRGDVVVPGGLRSAFLAAQKELKAKYPDPYYWGAFVMVGE